MSDKVKQCASDRFCRVRTFVQIAGVIIVIAIVVILLWQNDIIAF